jgi:monovalent cation:H+ antiporter, CPA1 family
MSEILLFLLFLTIFASVLQANFKIPLPITLMSSVIIFKAIGFEPFSLNDMIFDMLVIATMPLLISADALKLKWDDLKEHGVSLVLVACIGVVFSVFVGVLVNKFVLNNYPIPVPGIIMLFCIVSATDPVTVSAIFSNFKVPHKLKVLTEGESLFSV